MAAQWITAAPKAVLIQAILDIYPTDEIRECFAIGAETTLSQRLNDFTKPNLLEFLCSTPEGNALFQRIHELYPFRSPQSFYLVRIPIRPSLQELIQQTSIFASEGRNSALEFAPNSAVAAVYCAGEAKYSSELHVLEIPLAYERRVEIGIADPDHPRYAERDALYSLETAFIWLWDGYKHGIICCAGRVPVRSILKYGSSHLHIAWRVPTLTDEMYRRLAAGGTARTATFAASDASGPVFIDAQTITLYHPALADTNAYRTLADDPALQETAGYYGDHPAVLSRGVGVSRRYAHLWTPARMSQRELVSTALEFIRRTEEELKNEFHRSVPSYLMYFQNAEVQINNKTLSGRVRTVFDGLIEGLVYATMARTKEADLDSPELLKKLVEAKNTLCLSTFAEFDCSHCGIVPAQCPECGVPYEVLCDRGEYRLRCPQCENSIEQPDEISCDCGEVCQIISLDNHLRIVPQPPLLDAIDNHMREMVEVTWRNFNFLIRGTVIRLLPARTLRFSGRVRLEDFRSWRNARLRPQPPDAVRSLLSSVLRDSREKCGRNGGHPTREICDQCLAQSVTESQIRQSELCWPRIFGLPIAQHFDGIHHGREIADIIYADEFMPSGELARIGLHLKSYRPARRSGVLGRGTRIIKALYMQVSYSAYSSLIGQTPLDVIGIAVPNRIGEDVQQSLQELLNRMGFAFLVVDKDEWLRILDTSLEQVAFN